MDTAAALRAPRTLVTALTVLVVAALATGCSSTTSSTAKGAATVPPGASASATSPAGAAPATGAAASPTGDAATAAAQQCKPGVFRTNVALARGAFDTYVHRPATKGRLDPELAQTAAVYASEHLRTAAAAVKPCKDATSLHSVSLQTATMIYKTAGSLSAPSGAQRVDDAAAMLANVAVQAKKLRLDTTPKTPTRAQLKG